MICVATNCQLRAHRTREKASIDAHYNSLSLCLWNCIIKSLFLAFTRLFAEKQNNSTKIPSRGKKKFKEKRATGRAKDSKWVGEWREIIIWMFSWRTEASTLYRDRQGCTKDQLKSTLSSSYPDFCQSHTLCKHIRSCNWIKSSLQPKSRPLHTSLLHPGGAKTRVNCNCSK